MGISLIHSCAPLIRWQGIWLPKDLHNEIRPPLAFRSDNSPFYPYLKALPPKLKGHFVHNSIMPSNDRFGSGKTHLKSMPKCVRHALSLTLSLQHTKHKGATVFALPQRAALTPLNSVPARTPSMVQNTEPPMVALPSVIHLWPTGSGGQSDVRLNWKV